MPLFHRATAALLASAAFLTGTLSFATTARAEVLDDPNSIWTLQDENSSITTASLNDKFYVNGLRLGWTSPTDTYIPDFVAGLGHSLFGTDGKQRLSINVQQQIFTPQNTQASIPDPEDRPYAGTLLADFSLLQDQDAGFGATRSIVGFEAGLIGPDALARQVQNGFHSLIGDGHTNGWHEQIHDEPLGEIYGQKSWRTPFGSAFGLETDAVSTAEGGVGNLRVYGLGGSIFRIGQGLDSDFGPARPRTGLSGGEAYTATTSLPWYVFLGGDGQAVAQDITIDGNTWRHSASAGLQNFVGEAEIGAAILVGGTRISYTQVVQTEEIKHQRGGLHQFGSLTLAAKF